MDETTAIPTESTEAPEIQTENTVEPHSIEQDTITEAKRQGWVPQDEYDGPTEKWVDAETFVKKGKEINALLRKDNEFLKREVAEMKSTMMEFKKFSADNEKRAYERALSELREQKKQAVSQGDGDKLLEVDDAIEELKEQRAKEAQQIKVETNKPDPLFVEWNDENKWFGKDTELTEEANMIGETIKRRQPTLIGREFLDEVTKRVKKMYPEKFTNANRDKPSPVEGTTGNKSSSKTGKYSFNDLPPEAKSACLKFEKQKLLSREEYIRDFFGE